MPINFDLKTVFVHIPKTGGQSVSSMLNITKGNQRDFYHEGLTHLPPQMIRERADVDGFYFFTFVRNPYDKIVSEYNWRMRNIMSRVYNEPTRKQMLFETYMETLLGRWDKLVEPWNEKAHVLPQHMFIEEGMDIFRFENFEDGCKEVQAVLGMNKPVPHVNAGHYNTKHTERTIEITRILYEKDFKLLGYDIDALP